ncbi:hypothetical protein EDD80_1231 [Anseongella ginsenosidimutans]|uniref:Uncharacterized protein n=1 Tax=Anseongella ginsenosidimutans TaxID=496056 RepID=A0A4R3KKA2_9SPHI|nr:hypothetical protein EDD80_1231 [Anseongella ginsenosidimutans]
MATNTKAVLLFLLLVQVSLQTSCVRSSKNLKSEFPVDTVEFNSILEEKLLLCKRKIRMHKK